MNTILRTQVVEAEPHWFYVDASELGWPPGYWPDEVTTNLGNGMDLIRDRQTPGGMTYRQTAGCISVYVLND